MLKSKIAGLSILCSALCSLPASASAAYTQVIDNFESGTLGSQWSVIYGTYPEDVDVYNAISAYYDGGEGPALYYPPEGSWMMVIESGAPITGAAISFDAYDGAVLQFSWFFHTLKSPNDGYDDSAGIAIVHGHTSDMITLITSGTTGGGGGLENTGWREFLLPLSAGPVDIVFWATNAEGSFTLDSQFAIDNIRVTYAVPEPSTYAMMLSALGLVGFAAYRRRTGLSRIEG